MDDNKILREVKFEIPKELEYKSNKATKFSANAFEWLETVAQALTFVTIIFAFIFCQVRVSGDSMIDTLQDNDRLIVWRWGYAPKNNDIVVVSKEQNYNEVIIKRVIATEGQSLNIDYSSGVGVITVDGVTLDEPYIKEATLPKSIYNQPELEIPSVIPTGYCFVMGDNRNGSTDSRSQLIGLIKNEDVVGKAVVRLYPFNKVGRIS